MKSEFRTIVRSGPAMCTRCEGYTKVTFDLGQLRLCYSCYTHSLEVSTLIGIG